MDLGCVKRIRLTGFSSVVNERERVKVCAATAGLEVVGQGTLLARALPRSVQYLVRASRVFPFFYLWILLVLSPFSSYKIPFHYPSLLLFMWSWTHVLIWSQRCCFSTHLSVSPLRISSHLWSPLFWLFRGNKTLMYFWMEEWSRQKKTNSPEATTRENEQMSISVSFDFINSNSFSFNESVTFLILLRNHWLTYLSSSQKILNWNFINIYHTYYV